MSLRPLTICLSAICVMFLIFPKPMSLSFALNNQELIKRSGIMNVKKAGSIMRSSGGVKKAVPKIHTLLFKPLVSREPGFDFTDEEIKKLKIWERGVVPYYIDVLSFADKVIRDRIRWFLNEVSTMTNLNFVELPRPPSDYNNLRWVFFLNRQSLLGCADHSIKNFTTTGAQRVVLGYDCINNGGGLADAVLAIAGVPPQHNAPNRDEYIQIFYKNIIPEKVYLYQKLENDEWLFHGLDYDYASAGHVSFHKHSANGRATFNTTNLIGDNNIGDQNSFSDNDIFKINILYNYISLNTQLKKPKCSKLFQPIAKTNLSTFIFKETMKPRKKPNRYLGISGETDKSEDKSTHSYENNEDKEQENSIISNESKRHKENGSSDKNSFESDVSEIKENVKKYTDAETDEDTDKETKNVNDESNQDVAEENSVNGSSDSTDYQEGRSSNNNENSEEITDLDDNINNLMNSQSDQDSEEPDIEITFTKNNLQESDISENESATIYKGSVDKTNSIESNEYNNISDEKTLSDNSDEDDALISKGRNKAEKEPLILHIDPLSYLSDYETAEVNKKNIPKRRLWQKEKFLK